MCLQETWRTGVEELSEDGWLFVGSAPASQQGRGRMGVGIMLSPLGTTALDERHTNLGPRVVAVRLLVNETGGPRPRRQLGLFIISAYAPISTASDADWDAYYDTLGCAISRARPGDTVIIGTDANASIGRGRLDGSCNDTRAGGVGPHGLVHINETGRRMRSFLETHALASLASFFRKKHYGTWQHPRSKMMHQLDHILVSRDELKRFRDAGSLPGQLLGSDHRPVDVRPQYRAGSRRVPHRPADVARARGRPRGLARDAASRPPAGLRGGAPDTAARAHAANAARRHRRQLRH